MKISKEAARAARQLFRLTVKDGRVDTGIAKKLVKRISEEKPRNYIQMLSAYQRLLRLELEKKHAVIESAIKLGKGTQDEVLKDLKGKYGKDVTSEFHENKDLLGGMRIKVGSDVWDGSIRNRLNTLADNFFKA